MERRSFFKGLMIGGACAAVVPSFAFGADEKKPATQGKYAMSLKDAENSITGGKAAKISDKIKLEVPEIAENGRVVPVKVSVDSPMTKDDYIKTINVLAEKNGNARCANIFLTPANGEAYFSTRVKLGGTQDIVIIAETSKGEFLKLAKNVKVTIGGCG